MKPVTKAHIDALLPFLDRFEGAEFSAGTWKGSPGSLPHFNLDEVVTEFLQVLHAEKWTTAGFNWTKWQRSANEFVKSPDKIGEASIETIQKLFTTHVRKERFCEGHLASMLENGHIVLLLRRLKAIRAEMDHDHHG